MNSGAPEGWSFSIALVAPVSCKKPGDKSWMMKGKGRDCYNYITAEVETMLIYTNKVIF